MAGKQPRKRRRKLPPGYRLEFSTPVNGRVGKTTVTVLDADGKTKTTDQGRLADGGERTKVVKRLADRLGVTLEELLPQFEQGWTDTCDKARQQQEAAAAGLPEAAPCSPCSPGSEYEERGHRIYRRRRMKDAPDVLEPLANFTAKITGEDVLDDGSGELRHTFRVEGTLHNGSPLPPAAVAAGDFGGMAWVPKAWGCRANPAAGLGAKDHLRAAIQELSDDPPRRVIYQHTGWRQIGGRWYYLHAGGGIGADGSDPGILVQLDGSLGRYVLPAHPTGDALEDCIRAVLGVLDFGPARIMFPVVAAAFRAPLGRADTSLHLIGPTGQGKSELAALVQQFFGPGMDRLNLPANWSSTANSLEALAFQAKDALIVIDDFKPGGSKHDIDQWHAKADRVLRAQGNGSGRQRCRPDGTARPDRPPRGFIASTGEDCPRGESLQARNVPIPVNKGDIPITDLTSHQEAAARGLYAGAMAAYLRSLAAEYDALQGRLPEEHAELRSRALAAFTPAHARIPGAVADLFLGLTYFCRFAWRAGVITERDREGLEARGWQALLDAAQHQSAAVEGQGPALRFLRLLAAAVASGRAHLTDRGGAQPADPALWGWREEEGTHLRPGGWTAQGRQAGWVDGEELYLEPDVAYAEVQRFGDDQGERLALTQTQLYKRLKEAGHLASFEKDKTTKRVTLQGRARFVLHLRMGSLCAQKQGEPGGPGE